LIRNAARLLARRRGQGIFLLDNKTGVRCVVSVQQEVVMAHRHHACVCGGETKVLLAEDDPVNRMVAMSALRKLGCEVTVAVDGAEAVARFMDGPEFDLVLMDIQMPVMDGFEATRRIRRFEDGASHVPVIALTALDFSEARRKCAEVGMDGFAPKPLRLSTFAGLVETHVRQAPAQGRREPELAAS